MATLPDMYNYVHLMSYFILAYATDTKIREERDMITITRMDFWDNIANRYLRVAIQAKLAEVFRLDDILFGLDAMAAVKENLNFISDSGCMELACHALVSFRTDGRSTLEREDIELLGAVYIISELAKIDDNRRKLSRMDDVIGSMFLEKQVELFFWRKLLQF